ncbi:hypothetical protein LLE49_11510 [Alicyclobacillus tolerans]|uniref:hypothetical protein n=1 Tax=Alicyclobacillus tolerans TaxID=90970 RepID=UPI001F453697|nr:hypothetical protein [Alicyclobacillus tolerans]MCF8565344.1 hypothetical protein [Alicyclobacillus tolerans]
MRLNSFSGAFIGAVALAGLAYVFPMRTSLGQGITENVLTAWVGTYDPANHIYELKMEYGDGTSTDIPMAALPMSDFTNRSSSRLWYTQNDLTAALERAHQQSPSGLEQQLGTHANVAAFGRPFSGSPVAYSTEFLKVLQSKGINPKQFGGPDIPPGTVDYAKLPDGILHIDTLADGNTIHQLLPGQIPPLLLKMNPSVSR